MEKKGVIMINLFLDDLRPCPERFTLARNTTECRLLLLENKINVLSLDHDLGTLETGYDLVKWMVAVGLNRPEIYPKEIFLHTANPVGRDNMYQLLNRYKPDWVKLHYGPMPCND
jgi:hypothetical protein